MKMIKNVQVVKEEVINDKNTMFTNYRNEPETWNQNSLNVLNEVSEEENEVNGLKNETTQCKVESKEEYYYINDIIKRTFPSEYEENNIYPKIYCYEKEEFEDFKKKVKNKNELRHFECYSTTMNEYFDRFNDNYYEEILKNEQFRKFAEELWNNRMHLTTEQEYQDMCIQLRKKYKVSPSKHQITVALQYYHMKESQEKQEETKEEIRENIKKEIKTTKKEPSSTTTTTATTNEKKDVQDVIKSVDKMIITKELKNYKDLDKESVNLLQMNKRKSVRSNSGVLVITIITHPHKFSCKYDCYYCPNEPNQPRSYLSTEPAILRANQNNFDAICQFFSRTTTLVNNGHVPDKLEVLVLGGTWSCYSVEYQREFIRDIYYAANIYPTLKNRREKLSMEEEIELNEISDCRIIGLTLETRPDQINTQELIRLRSYGCTRVQIGIQHTDDFILKKINRQCTLKECIKAVTLLKDNGFKVDIHLMPDLPYSTVQKDIEMFQYVLSSPELQVDQWKIYPCEITPFTQIEKWYNEGKFLPYFEQDKNLLIGVIFLIKKAMHPWIRLNRVIRDIPNPSIIAGNNITNMRQYILHEMNIRNIFCQCIRCKEIKNQKLQKGSHSIFLDILQYDTVGGQEYFISFQGKKEKPKQKQKPAKQKHKNRENRKKAEETVSNDYPGTIKEKKKEGEEEECNYDNEHALLGFVRLRLRDENNYSEDRPFKCLENCALIRELHVYGSLLKHDDFTDLNFIQHRGLGKCLVLVAEMIAFHKGFRKMAIIAGVGTREYYKKLGYTKEETYVTKTLTKEKLEGSYEIHKERIGDILQIKKYNLKYSLYLMSKSVNQPKRNVHTIFEDLNSFVNTYITPLGSSKYDMYKQRYTISEFHIDDILERKRKESLVKHSIDIIKNIMQMSKMYFFTTNYYNIRIPIYIFLGVSFISGFQWFRKHLN